MSYHNSYITARNAYARAVLFVFYHLAYGVFIPVGLLIASCLDGGDFGELIREFFTVDVWYFFVGFQLINTVAILAFSLRNEVGLWSVIVGWLKAFGLVRVILFIGFLIVISITDLESSPVRISVPILWIIMTVIIPVVSVILLPNLRAEYRDNKDFKPRRGHRCNRNYRGTSVGSYSFSDTRSTNDTRWSTRSDDYDYDCSSSSYSDYDSYYSYEPVDYYSSSTDYDSYDSYSYESYKESENYYTPADSYAIYESYYS